MREGRQAPVPQISKPNLQENRNIETFNEGGAPFPRRLSLSAMIGKIER
jgi:hypothetical protein